MFWHFSTPLTRFKTSFELFTACCYQSTHSGIPMFINELRKKIMGNDELGGGGRGVKIFEDPTKLFFLPRPLIKIVN
jgi:hypothetical protein